MNWKLEYLPEAEKDLKDLNGSQRILVLKAIKKVQQNPLPVEEQGYGKPLGNHSSTNLAGLLKIKLRSAGLLSLIHIFPASRNLLEVSSTCIRFIFGTRLLLWCWYLSKS